MAADDSLLHAVDRRRGERYQRALLHLGDLLRPLVTADAIAAVAAEVCGDCLRSARAGYGEVDALGANVEIGEDWRRDLAMPAIAGRYRF